VADSLIAPKFSKAVGRKRQEFGKFAYLSDFREAAGSVAAPGVEYFVTRDCANGQITVTSHTILLLLLL